MTDYPPWVADMVKVVHRMTIMPNSPWKRLRIAVTEAEYEELRQIAHSRGEHFTSAIRGIALVKDEHPREPLMEIDPFESGGIKYGSHLIMREL